jgi:hypothetical protein
MIDHLRRIVRHSLLAAAMAITTMAHAGNTSLSVQVSAPPTVTASAVARILEKRFDTLKPGIFDSVRAQAVGDRVVVSFSGWSPAPEQAAYLLRTVGRFKVSLRGQRDDPLMTEGDVADSRPSIRGDRPELAIRLTDAAAARVAQRTRSAVGEEVTVEWEGRILSRLRISGPLGRDIALAAGSLDEARSMSAVLRGGRLPDGVALTPVR